MENSAMALASAERRGFRLAVYGRTFAALLMAAAAIWGYHYPGNFLIAALFLVFAAIGILPIALARTSAETASRYALFALDALVISALIAFAPLSSGDEIPQNLVFLTSRVHFYYIAIIASVLTLSPRLVLWTGAWSVAGLSAAVAWIASKMTTMLSYADLPPGPSRQTFYSVVLSPDFLGIASRLQEVLVIGAVTCIAALAVNRARRVALARAHAESGRRRLRRIFGKYVPTHVVEDLANSDGRIQPQTREASIIFADVEGFTSIAEHVAPEAVISILNELFSAAASIVASNGGLMITYIGDAFIASFNAPIAADDHARRAILAARQILETVGRQDFAGHRLSLRIGVASGAVAAGTVGSEDRLSYTLYGDTVNLAQRLEGLNKKLGTRCLISGETVNLSGTSSGLVRLDPVTVRNRVQPVDLYTLRV